ncbi:MAG TPA: hypothetical protein VGU73_01300 [Acidimicrobiia bacterium]|nr:hypothetical protein [Acidimicrobiia bacterium]
MTEHVHVHSPEGLAESGRSGMEHEHAWELAATVLLAVATLGIAWSGYQAARWTGVQAQHYAQSNAARSTATRVSTNAGQERLQDLLNFNRWLEVTTDGNQTLADLYQRRFRAEFVPAFEAWLAQNPLQNSNAVASPLNMPQYHPAAFAQAAKLANQADQDYNAGKDATRHTDDYVLTTVFFAAVLFFAGVSLRFKWDAMRLTVLVFGGAFLTYGLVRIATLPHQ